MQLDIIQLIAMVLPVGVFYGATNARIKSLEKNISHIENMLERLARIEEKLTIFINQNAKKNETNF